MSALSLEGPRTSLGRVSGYLLARMAQEHGRHGTALCCFLHLTFMDTNTTQVLAVGAEAESGRHDRRGSRRNLPSRSHLPTGRAVAFASMGADEVAETQCSATGEAPPWAALRW